MTKMPEEYRPKTKSRKGIVQFLGRHDGYYRHHAKCSPIAWDVKASGVDLSFDHLLDLYRKDQGDPDYTHFEEWLTPVQALYAEHEERLFDWGIDGARDVVTDTDCYNHLYDGTPVAVKYEFEGRSGGWLIMTDFEGHKLANVDRDDFLADIADKEVWPFEDLWKLYRLVIMLDHDLRREAVESEVEHQAAFAFFDNICVDVPQVEKTQTKLPLA